MESVACDSYFNIPFMNGWIEETAGTELTSIDWVYWLSLPFWSKKEAVLLVCGLNPNQFHQVESHKDYNSMCEPFFRLSRSTLDESNTPFDWLIKFKNDGYLDCAPRGVHDWLTQQIEQAQLKPKAEAVAIDGAGSIAETEPASVKVIQTNSNDLDFSGLLHEPAKKDDWFSVIDDMTKAFFNEYKKIPNDTQAWGQLSTTTPEGYVITTGKDKGEDCLFMPGVKPLNKSAFSKRWANYTANKT